MSVRLLHNNTISYIAKYFLDFAPEEWKDHLKKYGITDVASLGALLWQLNARAFDDRYGANEHKLDCPRGYRYYEPAYSPTATPAYKAMMEWLYQIEGSSSEHHPLANMIKQLAFDTAFDIISRTISYREAQIV